MRLSSVICTAMPAGRWEENALRILHRDRRCWADEKPGKVRSMPKATLGWGIIATGAIATKFAEDLDLVDGAAKIAVFSRSAETGAAFAARHGFAGYHQTFESFLADPEIDAVYVASPHVAHLDQALAAIEAGKAVVIEKPVTMTGADARRIGAAAQAKGVFAMEAMWTRFLPAVQRAKALVEAGTIGTIERVDAELGFETPHDPNHRLFNKALGGGVLHDLGVYPLSITQYLAGDATLISSSWTAAPRGVDLAATLTLQAGDAPVTIRASFAATGENTVVLYGSEGTLRLDRHFLRGPSVTIWDRTMRAVPPSSGSLVAKIRNRLPFDGRTTERFDYPGNGLHFEIRSAQTAILAGATSSAINPLEDSAEVLDIVEDVLSKPPKT
jgi:predicted dehydrogenase